MTATKSINRVLNAQIIEMEDAFAVWKSISKQNPKAKAHKHNLLRVAVAKVVETLIQGINQGALKADHTGLLLGDSGYDAEINKLALEEAHKIELASPGSIGAANEARIKGTKGFRATLKNGTKFVYDKAIGSVTFIYGKVKRSFVWVAGLAKDLWTWIKSLVAKIFTSSEEKSKDQSDKSKQQAKSGENGPDCQGVVDDLINSAIC